MENWKEIEGYAGLYEISDQGRVRSQKKILRCNIKRNGYYTVDLSKGNVKKTCSVHRLVAMAFLERKDENANQVNHKNGNKSDNRAVNLEWCTGSENIRHGLATATNKKNVFCRELKMSFGSSYEAAEYLNKTIFHNSRQVKNLAAKIRSCCCGFQKKAYGMTWYYI